MCKDSEYQCAPRSAVTISGTARSPQKAWKNPNRPSSTVGGPVRPAVASCAADTPQCAAHPVWMRLTLPPVRFASSTPDPMLAAIATASARVPASPPDSIVAATADPIAPQMELACWPRSKKIELPSSPS